MVSTFGVQVSRTPRRVLVLTFFVLLLEGYDLIVFGTVVPALLGHAEWGLTVKNVGALGSVAVFGMLIGALLAGTIADLVGRRAVIMGSAVTFSLAMALCGVAPTIEVFIAGRLLVGVGAGCLMPTAIAMVVEYSPGGRRNINSAIAFAGVGVGGALSGLLALAFVPDGEFRPMFLLGAVPALVILPLLARFLPESAEHLLASGRATDAQTVLDHHGIDATIVETDASPLSTDEGIVGRIVGLFADGWAPTTLLFWSVMFLNLLLLFSTSTWLPSLMTAAGFGIESALTFLLVLNLGAVVGGLAASSLADRWGSRVVISGSFMAAALAFVLIASGPPMPVTYVLVALAGLGSSGTQLLVNTFVGSSYPTRRRATGLGFALGIGRLGGILGPTVGGYVLAANLPQFGNFFAFAIPAIVAAVLVLVISPPKVSTASSGALNADGSVTNAVKS